MPGAADTVFFLEDDPVVDSGVLQLDGCAETCKTCADDGYFGGVCLFFAHFRGSGLLLKLGYGCGYTLLERVGRGQLVLVSLE